MAAYHASLLEFLLSQDLEPAEISGALREFVFRSILDNRRVRKWCEDVGDVLKQASHSSLGWHSGKARVYER